MKTWRASDMAESLLLTFLKARQAHCEDPLNVVSVDWIGGATENLCFGNAYERSLDPAFALISGWLALPDKVPLRWKQFTQHWWNFDRSTGRHVDFSPAIERGAIYVEDISIAKFAQENQYRLSSCVPRSVIYSNGSFYAVHPGDTGFAWESISQLDNETLFAPYFIRDKSM